MKVRGLAQLVAAALDGRAATETSEGRNDMASFNITPVEKGIMRCRHTGSFSHEDVQALAHFLHDYRGKLLIDLPETTGEECEGHIHQFRPMMPTAAIFGARPRPGHPGHPRELLHARGARLPRPRTKPWPGFANSRRKP